MCDPSVPDSVKCQGRCVSCMYLEGVVVEGIRAGVCDPSVPDRCVCGSCQGRCMTCEKKKGCVIVESAGGR